MSRSENSQLAVNLYSDLLQKHNWPSDESWKGIALLLLTCEIYSDLKGWTSFKDVVIHCERNKIHELESGGKSAAWRRAEHLTQYISDQLGIPRKNLCSEIGQFFELPETRDLQPNNLLGGAFRSITVEILKHYGDGGLNYREEVNPRDLFPGNSFPGQSPEGKVDIVAERGDTVVALISARWRYRHDRPGVIKEARAYASAARRVNPNCELYAILGEFSVARLEKVLNNCPPNINHPALSGAVHFEPKLVTEGLHREDDIDAEKRLKYLDSLDFLINDTHSW